MENYIVINGKKSELTPEQIKALGIGATRANAFERDKNKGEYYSIDVVGKVFSDNDFGDSVALERFRASNYCTDKDIMEQRALHEILSRQLWRFSMTHDGDKIDWDSDMEKYYIGYDHYREVHLTGYHLHTQHIGAVYFYSSEIAHQAINEIVKPFMAEHPDFKW